MPASSHHHESPGDRQTWYAITIDEWGPLGPQAELIVTRDAGLTIRRTVEYLVRTGERLPAGLAGSVEDPGWLAENPPPDASTAPLREVETWLDSFMEHTSRPALEWHRIPAPPEDSGEPYDPRD